MTEGSFKVAAVQMLSFEGEQERNLKRMLDRIAEAAGAGAQLIVFPEASNNGYFFEDRADAHRKATSIPGPFTEALGREAAKHGVWVVTCPPEMQLRRMIEQRGMTEAEARARLDAQPPIEPKLALATEVIDNSGTLDDLRQQVTAAWGRFQASLNKG